MSTDIGIGELYMLHRPNLRTSLSLKRKVTFIIVVCSVTTAVGLIGMPKLHISSKNHTLKNLELKVNASTDNSFSFYLNSIRD
jgi:hypothetical protein